MPKTKKKRANQFSFRAKPQAKPKMTKIRYTQNRIMKITITNDTQH